jgi:hypothetical protein
VNGGRSDRTLPNFNTSLRKKMIILDKCFLKLTERSCSYNISSLHTCGLTVHCRIHKSPPLLPILNQRNSVHILRFNIILPSFHLHQGPESGLVDSGLLNKFLCAIRIAPMSATCQAHLSLDNLIILLICGKE